MPAGEKSPSTVSYIRLRSLRIKMRETLDQIGYTIDKRETDEIACYIRSHISCGWDEVLPPVKYRRTIYRRFRKQLWVLPIMCFKPDIHDFILIKLRTYNYGPSGKIDDRVLIHTAFEVYLSDTDAEWVEIGMFLTSLINGSRESPDNPRCSLPAWTDVYKEGGWSPCIDYIGEF